jgi:hypothetical protein
MDQHDLLCELTPVAERLFDRHDRTAKEWFPHELVPWSRGRDVVPGQVWDPDETPTSDAVRSALFVNLLTEDNLPYYFRTIEALFGADSIWGTWVRRWTAEEGRHSIVIRDRGGTNPRPSLIDAARTSPSRVGRGRQRRTGLHTLRRVLRVGVAPDDERRHRRVGRRVATRSVRHGSLPWGLLNPRNSQSRCVR